VLGKSCARIHRRPFCPSIITDGTTDIIALITDTVIVRTMGTGVIITGVIIRTPKTGLTLLSSAAISRLARLAWGLLLAARLAQLSR
jgi:hypothetical protein